MSATTQIGKFSRRIYPFLLSVRFRSRKGGLIFLFCFGLAAFFWLVNAFSQSYYATLRIAFEYAQVPVEMVMLGELPSRAEIRVQATGWRLIREGLRGPRTLLIDPGPEIDDIRTYDLNTHPRKWSHQFPSDLEVLQFLPSKLVVETGKRLGRKIPVKLKSRINFMPQYDIVGAPMLTPDSIYVNGPSKLIDTMREASTIMLKEFKVRKDLTGQIRLDTAGLAAITFSSTLVEYVIKVEQFTETQIQVPIRVINPPKSVNIQLLEQTVWIAFQIPLPMFEQSRQQDFSDQFDVVADFAGIGPDDSEINLELLSYPGFLNRVNFAPKSVEFLLIHP